MDSAIFIFRELGTDARIASLYANTIGKAKDLNISINKFKEFLETLKKQVQNVEKDDVDLGCIVGSEDVTNFDQHKFLFNYIPQTTV